MIWKRAGIFLIVGAFLLLGSGCAAATALPPNSTVTSPSSSAATPFSTITPPIPTPGKPSSTLALPSSTITPHSPTPSTPTAAELTAWIRSDRQTEAVPEPIYEVGRDTVTLHFGANQDAAYALYAFYDFYASTKSEEIGKGTLKANQEASLELAAAGGLRAFRLAVEAAGQQVTATASVLCLWVD